MLQWRGRSAKDGEVATELWREEGEAAPRSEADRGVPIAGAEESNGSGLAYSSCHFTLSFSSGKPENSYAKGQPTEDDSIEVASSVTAEQGR